MNVENIDKVIAIMKRIPKEQFYIETYQSKNKPEGKYYYNEEEVLENCGTTCCVSGWVRVSPEFRDLHDKNIPDEKGFCLPNKTTYQSFAQLLDISTGLTHSIIFARNDLYSKYLKSNFTLRDIEPKHVIRILNDIKKGKLE